MSKKKIYITLPLALAIGLLCGFGLGYYLQQTDAEKWQTDSGTPISAKILSTIEDSPPTLTINDDIIATKGAAEMLSLFELPLRQYQKRPCEQHTEGIYKQYIAQVSQDNKQAIIGHGCGSKGFDLSVLVMTDDGQWHKIGAKKFSLDIDDKDAAYWQEYAMVGCETAERYGLVKEIAPVCFDANKNVMKR